MKEKIGIFGGTFNPIHNGHLLMVQDAMEAFDLARVLFVPCAVPPHKRSAGLVSTVHRVAMLEAALDGNPDFELCDLEIRRGGTSYTIDTLRKLKQRYPEQELCLIIGSDTLPELCQWRDIGGILALCRIVTVARPGFELAALKRRSLKLKPPWPRRLLKDVVAGHGLNVSSSNIRYRVAEGMTIRYLVPQAVEAYVHEQHLYVR